MKAFARLFRSLVLLVGLALAMPLQAQDWVAKAQQHTIELPDFTFHTGEKLPSVKMHVYTLGTPRRDSEGRVTNAIMLLHGTGGNGTSLLAPHFGDELFGEGQLFDIGKYYIISPDNLGHGQSSKPSDGLRAQFPRYDYSDMVLAQHRMLTEGLGVDRLYLVLGTSMGCMHSFVWGPSYPGFVERFVPLACNAIEIAGRNRMFRQMVIDGFRDDPEYRGGDYADGSALRTGQATNANILLLAGSNPYRMQAELPTRDAAVEALHRAREAVAARNVDPNDAIYQLDSSRNYNPAPQLHLITAPVLWINSADDFINPPGLGDPEALAQQMPHARFVLIPASAESYGHGTHSRPKLWKAELERFLSENP